MKAGTTHTPHEHWSPLHVNDPSLELQWGQNSFPSLPTNAPTANSSGSTKYDEQPAEDTEDCGGIGEERGERW